MPSDSTRVTFCEEFSIERLKDDTLWPVGSSDSVYGGTLPRVGDEVLLSGNLYKVKRVIHNWGNIEAYVVVSKKR